MILTIGAMLLQTALSASIGRSYAAAAAAWWYATSAISAGWVKAAGAAGGALCPEINLTWKKIHPFMKPTVCKEILTYIYITYCLQYTACQLIKSYYINVWKISNCTIKIDKCTQVRHVYKNYMKEIYISINYTYTFLKDIFISRR